jgi:hypothetical protein
MAIFQEESNTRGGQQQFFISNNTDSAKMELSQSYLEQTHMQQIEPSQQSQSQQMQQIEPSQQSQSQQMQSSPFRHQQQQIQQQQQQQQQLQQQQQQQHQQHQQQATSGSQQQMGSTGKLHTSSSPNVVGMHYKVGKKIGEGSFGIIYEGIVI